MTWEQFRKHVRNLVHGRHNVQEHEWDDTSSVRIGVQSNRHQTPARTLERRLQMLNRGQ